jgi:hypothetical protein
MHCSTLLGCQHCQKLFTPTNRRQRFCGPNCRAAAHYLPKKEAAQARAPERLARKLERFRTRRRAVSLGFDGRSSGPFSQFYRGTSRSLIGEVLP